MTASAFDPTFYTENHPDLAGLLPDEAWGHYDAFGRAEGRVGSPLARREGLLAVAREARFALEIGPFCSPVLTGDNIRYLDVLTAPQLRERAAAIGLDVAGCPQTIHYVDGLAGIGETFDAIVSSHSIEHQPDLIGHLNEVARLLESDGRYHVIVPDKRYCFDHFIAPSTIAPIIAAHRQERRMHSLESVLEHVALTTHNDPARHWAGDHGAPLDPDGAMRVEAAMRLFDDKAEDYIDVHAWYFTPDTFRTNIEILYRLGLTRMRAVAVCDTPRDRQEFCAILEPA